MFDLFYSSKETSDSLKNRGNILLNEGRVPEAEQLYRRAAELDPGFMPARYNLGNVLRMQGRFGEALAEYEAALKLAPGDYEICMNMGATLLDLGRAADALQTFSRANKLMPTAAEPLVNMGLALERMGHSAETSMNPDAAIEHYRKALSIRPDFVEALNNLGFALQSQGNFDEAAENYRKALSIKPDFAEAHNNLGNVLQSQGRFEEAIECFQHALSLRPDFADAHYNQGNAYKDLQLFAEAEVNYRKVLKLDPRHIKTLNSLGSLLMEDGRADEALACFQQAIHLDPKNGTASHLIASITGIDSEGATSQYVTELFDGLANNYDANLVGSMNYEVPEKLFALIANFAKPDAKKWDVLDLGCGTGLAGSVISPYARQLVGVDLSSGMLAKAQEKNLYQRLERSELLAMMKDEMAASYDVIIAADVFVYIGRLDTIMKEIKRLLRPGGILTFSLESLEALTDEKNIKDYQLNQTGRYAHSSGYIDRIALASGFNKLNLAPDSLRIEKGEPVQGWLVLLENTGDEGS